MWGDAIGVKRGVGGRSGELSALIALSGSKRGTCRAVMYRCWREMVWLWSRAMRPLCYVRPSLHFQTLTLSKDIGIIAHTLQTARS